MRTRMAVTRLLCIATAAAAAHAAGLDPAAVMILVNRDTGISNQVAQMYSSKRAIPAGNILTLPMGTDRQISQDQFSSRVAGPVKEFLDAHREIRCIVTTSGVPYTIRGSNDKDPGAALDSELAGVLRYIPGQVKRRKANPEFAGGITLTAVVDPRMFQMVYVARLDGPDLKTITRMVDDAIATEQAGLEGPVFGDAQGLDLVTGSGVGDASIRAATDLFSGAGFPATLDMKPESWKQPASGPGDQAAGAAFYLGWYDLNHFQNIFGKQGLARGAIAWHIASQEAQDIWSANSTGWCVNLLRRGAAVTIGPVSEPYLDAFPHGAIFAEALLSGRSVAESYWLALPHFSWQMVLLGDPLYTPFGKHPRPTLIARAYVAASPAGTLAAHQSGSLNVIVECVGPAGASTPALTGTVHADFGLAEASGSVTIPAIKAGETAVVKIPKVTMGSDPYGMFRLRIDAQDEAANHRAIMLEGRNGLARLTPEALSKLGMNLNPAGDVVIARRPGDSVWVETATLATKSIVPPDGFMVVSADFSPDGKRVVIDMLNPLERKVAAFLADKSLANREPLPLGSRFLKWLDADHLLLLSGTQLVSHSLSGGKDTTFPMPEDWTKRPVGGTVIPGTKILFLTSEDGKIGYVNGDEPFQEVLRGTRAVKSSAIANDLSMFAGVDRENRLWVQRGVSSNPQILANNIDHVVWGPVSHRGLVVDENGKGRIYDSRDRSWIDVGTVGAAQWSADENSLLFAVRDGSSEQGSLSLLRPDRTVEKLCDLSRIGPIEQIELSSDGKRAFLLAGISGQLAVWMISLPGAK